MLINNILFIHIPKTAGTSIEYWLGEKYNYSTYDIGQYIFSKQPNNLYLGYDKQHYPIQYFIENKISYNFSFSVVRNPYDRLLSAFKFFKLYIEKQKFGIASNLSIIDWFLTEHITDFNHITTYNHHLLPQHLYISAAGNNILNYIVRYENLIEDIRKLCTKINIAYSPIPKKFVSNLYVAKSSINHIISIINDYYYKDFQLFKYKIQTSL